MTPSCDLLAAALSADVERMLSECCELLECAWNVGENGIDAATAAAAAAGGEGALDNDIKAATTSIRSWRFVQVRYTAALYTSCHPTRRSHGAATGPQPEPRPALTASLHGDSAFHACRLLVPVRVCLPPASMYLQYPQTLV